MPMEKEKSQNSSFDSVIKVLGKPFLGVVLVVILAGTVGYYIYSDIVATSGKSEGIQEKEREVVSIGGLDIEVEDGSSPLIEEIPIPIEDATDTKNFEIPDLNRPIVFPDFFPEEARGTVTAYISELILKLKEDPSSFGNWLDLALQRKLIDDYIGTRDIWEYLNVVFPTNSITFANLGNLYHLQLKDFRRSEENFMQAIANNPLSFHAYRGLHELYVYSYKQNTEASADILKEGLERMPNNIDILLLLAGYYKNKNDVQNAKIYFELAHSEAEKQGNVNLADLITTDLESL